MSVPQPPASRPTAAEGGLLAPAYPGFTLAFAAPVASASGYGAAFAVPALPILAVAALSGRTANHAPSNGRWRNG